MPGSVTCSFTGQAAWQQVSVRDSFKINTIYVWHGITNDLLPLYDFCFALLDPTEQVRALRYYQLKDKQRYVIQHGILRVLLGRYLNIAAKELRFTYNQNKKPYLDYPGKNCFFNISHTAGEFLIAIADIEVGVDIERINPDFAFADVASHYFSADEVSYIDNSSNPTEAFFLLWTRKEALLKACGTGIDDDLPAMPALDGQHKLPANYPETNWLTESLYVGKSAMGSITYPATEKGIVFNEIDKDWVQKLFSAV